MKVLVKIIAWIGIALILLVVATALFLGPIIKTGVETIGPKVTGVGITLQKAGINLFTGDVKITGLVVKNPKGFQTDSLMELGRFVAKLDMASLLSDTIVIKQIHIDGPVITYERGLKTSNLGTLQKNIAPQGESVPAADKPDVAEDKKMPAKKVVIEDFLFENGKINVSITLAGGKQITVPLAPIHLENIGQKSNGSSITEVVTKVVEAITKSAGKAIAASGDLAGDALKGASDLIKDPGAALQNVGGSASDAAKGATEGLKKLGGSLFNK